ncbi:MAG: DNA-binding protein [Deltaproteobacteria bacterium]|nr:DNA-binding protein [Deltaproteobacteria bacterium]
MPERSNAAIADALDEVGTLLAAQDAHPSRVAAYCRAAAMVRTLPEPLAPASRRLPRTGVQLPGIGPSLARAIGELAATGRLGLLDRLRGHDDGEARLTTVPGIGPALAHRIHETLGIETLEELEHAARTGRLTRVPGFGRRRARMVLTDLQARLQARLVRPAPTVAEPPVAEMLAVDRAYRERARTGTLVKIAPRRLNPTREAWLPVMHVRRGAREYTALFSNTARSHALGTTRDWVVLYVDEDHHERQATIVTERCGPLAGKRVVRGREIECEAYYAGAASGGIDMPQPAGDASLAPRASGREAPPRTPARQNDRAPLKPDVRNADTVLRGSS